MDKINSQSLKARLKGKTPKFWRKIRNLMITLGSIGGAIALLPAEHTAWLPENLASILITIGTVGTALSSLTVQDPPQPPSEN